MIRGIVAEPEVGVIYTGKVVKTAEFGAFVNFLGAKDGLVHISELAQTRVAKTTDVVKEGDQVRVKVLGFDDRGKVKLSMRVVDQATGADITEQVGAKRRGAGADGRDHRVIASGRRRPGTLPLDPAKGEPLEPIHEDRAKDALVLKGLESGDPRQRLPLGGVQKQSPGSTSSGTTSVQLCPNGLI